MASAKRRVVKAKNAAPGERSKLLKLGCKEAGLSVKELRRALKEGSRYASEEDWEKALPHLLKAWDAMPDDVALLTLIAQGLARLGVREFAVQVLERALQNSEPTADILTVMQNLAIEMGMYEVAVKVNTQLARMEPNSPRHYVNMATAMSGLKKYDESIDMLQNVLPIFPDSSSLWNVLATQVRARDGVDAADVFFEEAIRLAPDDYKIISNYAQSFSMRQQYDKALELSLKAIEANPETSEPRVGAAQIYFFQGNMQKGWEFYRHRLSHRRTINQTQLYTHDLAEWQGQSLEGKNLFVLAEQGIGDEVMFGNFLPFLYERVEKLAIGCDRRLVSIYQRRFPNAIISPYVDHIKAGYRYRTFPFIQGPMNEGELHMDYAIPLASAPEYDWKTGDDIKCHDDVFLIPDPERAADYKERIASISDKPKVGIAWRSGLTGGDRLGMYANVGLLNKIFAYKDEVDFINLQYGECKDELTEIKERYGVTVHHFEDTNLKADIEANLAIMSNVDVMIGACSAPGIFSMSLGVPTMLMHKGAPWYCFGQSRKIPFVKDCSFSAGHNGRTWEDIMDDVSGWMAERLNLKG